MTFSFSEIINHAASSWSKMVGSCACLTEKLSGSCCYSFTGWVFILFWEKQKHLILLVESWWHGVHSSFLNFSLLLIFFYSVTCPVGFSDLLATWNPIIFPGFSPSWEPFALVRSGQLLRRVIAFFSGRHFCFQRTGSGAAAGRRLEEGAPDTLEQRFSAFHRKAPDSFSPSLLLTSTRKIAIMGQPAF